VEARVWAFPSPPRWIGIAAVLLLCVAGTWKIATMTQRSSVDATVGQEVVAGHVRSLMAAHLTDVLSSDHHTVKPWFNGKLDFSPVVAEFEDRGFVLEGGRLDYLENRPVAALVYRRRQHVINFFTWPTSQPDSSIEAFDQQGYHAYHWTKSHVTYWSASDLNPKSYGNSRKCCAIRNSFDFAAMLSLSLRNTLEPGLPSERSIFLFHNI
jgi:anti-sigma factor RsiW